MDNLNFNKLSYRYDDDIDALLLKITRMYQYHVSLEVDPNIILDVSNIGRITAFEILDASRILRISKDDLIKQPRFNITVTVTKDLVKVYMNYTVDGFVGSFICKTINEGIVLPGEYKYYL